DCIGPPGLGTFGKAIRAGLPTSVVDGKKEIMDIVTEYHLHAGTVNANRLCSSVAKASITQLAKNEGADIKYLHEVGEKLIKGLQEAAQGAGIPVRFQGLGPCVGVYVTKADEISNWRNVLRK